MAEGEFKNNCSLLIINNKILFSLGGNKKNFCLGKTKKKKVYLGSNKTQPLSGITERKLRVCGCGGIKQLFKGGGNNVL